MQDEQLCFIFLLIGFDFLLYVFPLLMGFLPKYSQNLPRKALEEKMILLRQLLVVWLPSLHLYLFPSILDPLQLIPHPMSCLPWLSCWISLTFSQSSNMSGEEKIHLRKLALLFRIWLWIWSWSLSYPWGIHNNFEPWGVKLSGSLCLVADIWWINYCINWQMSTHQTQIKA